MLGVVKEYFFTQMAQSMKVNGLIMSSMAMEFLLSLMETFIKGNFNWITWWILRLNYNLAITVLLWAFKMLNNNKSDWRKRKSKRWRIKEGLVFWEVRGSPRRMLLLRLILVGSLLRQEGRKWLLIRKGLKREVVLRKVICIKTHFYKLLTLMIFCKLVAFLNQTLYIQIRKSK